ncbi:hypothetical protein ES708_25917 [subsurface metagenome]
MSELPPVNQAPVITTIPSLTAIAGVVYTYDVNATDPDGDTLAYSLATGTSMIIDSTTGVIIWFPTGVGSFPVIVQVSDGELSDTQSFTITVIAGTATKLLWVKQPAVLVTSEDPWDLFSIEITDKYDNRRISDDASEITIITEGAGTLTGGTFTETVVDGLATFDAFTYTLAEPPAAEIITIIGSSGDLTPTDNSVPVTVEPVPVG